MFLSNITVTSSNGVTPRKISRFNLDNLFAVLMNLVNLSGKPYASQLNGVIGLIFNKILIGFQDDASLLIGDLKLARAWYIRAIRYGDRGPIGMRPRAWNDVQSEPHLLQGVMPIIDAISQENDFGTCVFFHRVIFAMLSMDRVVVIPAKPNYNTITDPFKMLEKGSVENKIKLSEIHAALASLGITPDLFKEAYEHHVANFKYEVLSSMGPNGQSTWSAHSDVRAWAANPELFKQLCTFLEESGMGFMVDDMEGTLRIPEHDLEPQRHAYLGKLAVIEEWGGKARIVAALDYWSQMALSPLHNTVNSFLKELPMDGSFNQDAVVARMKGWTKDPSNELNCFDLTAATDRIPIELQSTVLSHLMGSTSYGQAWSKILVGRKYLCPDAYLRPYNVGQPMGARSSFPMLALIHHVLIQVAAARAKVADYTKYTIVGDDCALTNASVAANYKVITASHGIVINFSKSIEHGATLRPAGELCKRTFIEGHEISSIPVKQICKTIRDGRLAPQLQNELVRRDIGLDAKPFWQLMSTIMDKESLSLLIKDNIMPSEVNGLVRSIAVPGLAQSTPDTWFPGVNLSEADVVQVYTWTVASESLKRLDALLRQSLAIAALISLRADEGDPAFSGSLLSELRPVIQPSVEATAPDAAKAIKELPRLNSFHPIVQASDAEARRLADDLFLLSSADEMMTRRARSGLLDRFRNALTDIWTGRNVVSPSQDRSLMTKALRNLETIVLIRENNILEYTVVLAQVGRTWSVHLELGSKVMINAVKARVPTSMLKADATLSEVISGFNIIGSKGDPGSDAVKPRDLPRKTTRAATTKASDR